MNQRTSHDPADALEKILDDADALIRRRLQKIGREVPHLVVGITTDSQVLLRSNVDPATLRIFADDLKNVADQLTAPRKPGETQH